MHFSSSVFFIYSFSVFSSKLAKVVLIIYINSLLFVSGAVCHHKFILLFCFFLTFLVLLHFLICEWLGLSKYLCHAGVLNELQGGGIMGHF